MTPKVIKAFNLDYKPGEDITLSAQRKKHMEKHRQEFSDFDAIYERIPEIIAHPDYIGRHPDGQSLEYIKRIDGNVLVAVTLLINLMSVPCLAICVVFFLARTSGEREDFYGRDRCWAWR